MFSWREAAVGNAVGIGTVTTAMATAATTALFSQFMTGMVDTGGNLRESLNRLDNKDNLRQTVVSSLTAGALSYVGSIPLGEKGIKLNDISLANGSKLNEVLGKNLINAAVSAAVESAATGESFDAVLERSAMLALLKTGAAGAAFAIGGSGLTQDMKLALHGALGCVAGALKQGGSAGCAPGALGAVAAEAFAIANGDRIRANSASKEEADKKILEQASVVATVVGCATGGSAGCGTGGFTGANAVENNYLSNPADVRDPKIRQRILEAGQNCAGPSSCESMVAGMDAQIKLLSDDKIAAMCGTNAQCVTDRKDERGLYEQVRNDATRKLTPDEAAKSYLSGQSNAPYDKGQLSAAVTRVQNGTADTNDPVDQYVRNTLAANPAMFGAVLGVTIVDTDGGKSGAGGSKPSVKNTGAVGAKEGVNLARVEVDVSKATKGSPEYNILNSPPPNSHVKLSNGTEFKTNANGYVDEISYSPSTIQGVRDARQTAVGKEGLSTDVGGHVQACSLGGTCDRFNLFPQDSNFNNSAYKKWENEIKGALNSGDTVGPVTVRFDRTDPASARPDALMIDYSIARTYEGPYRWRLERLRARY